MKTFKGCVPRLYTSSFPFKSVHVVPKKNHLMRKNKVKGKYINTKCHYTYFNAVGMYRYNIFFTEKWGWILIFFFLY